MSLNISANWSYPNAFKLGRGRIKELADACKSLGMKKPLLVTDRGLASMAITKTALDVLEEAGERGAVATLMVERDVEEGVERVARLGAEPGEGEAAPAAGAEQIGEEAERAAAPGLARPAS